MFPKLEKKLLSMMEWVVNLLGKFKEATPKKVMVGFAVFGRKVLVGIKNRHMKVNLNMVNFLVRVH